METAEIYSTITMFGIVTRLSNINVIILVIKDYRFINVVFKTENM